MLCAVGITELHTIIRRLENGGSKAYLGISGIDVTKEISETNMIPVGVWVTRAQDDGPAMAAGIQKGDIIVGDDVWIGLKATICSGVKIGQGAIVAAGSVVVKDVAPYSIVGGNPAKFIKWRFEDEAVRERLMRLDWSKFNKGAVNKDNVVDLYAPASLSGIDDLERRFFTK